MNPSGRRQWLKSLAAAGLLTGAGLGGLIREALASGSRPILPGLYKITGNVIVNGKPA